MASHRVSCQCGALVLEAIEDPDFVIACNCRACQKRSGSPFGAVAYFRKDKTNVTGERKTWARAADSGRLLENYFCPGCGSTVCWTLEMRPDHIGATLGNFDTPAPEPRRVVWLQEKSDWVTFPEHWEQFERGSPE